MTMETIKYDLDADGIALFTIGVPGQSMNVITAELTRDFDTMIAMIEKDEAIKGAVITSGKASGFMAGADLKGMGGALSGNEASEHTDRDHANTGGDGVTLTFLSEAAG